VVGADAVELVEEVLLRREVLDDRLEDEVALLELAEVGDAADPPEHGLALGCVELAPLHLPGERLLEAGEHAVGAFLGATAQDHPVTCARGDLGHAGAHDPRPDDPDLLDGHGLLLLVPATAGGRRGYPPVGRTQRAGRASPDRLRRCPTASSWHPHPTPR